MSEDNWILQTITPKSDQLNADDLISGPATVTVTGVKRGSAEQPVAVELSGYEGRPYKPCKSMRRVLVAIWGDRPGEWVGRSMTLYCDPEVKFGGMRVGGIRISHMSHIDKPTVLLLTATRGKKSEMKIEPLANDNDPAKRAAKAVELAAKAGSLDELERIEAGAKKVLPAAFAVKVVDACRVRAKELV